MGGEEPRHSGREAILIGSLLDIGGDGGVVCVCACACKSYGLGEKVGTFKQNAVLVFWTVPLQPVCWGGCQILDSTLGGETKPTLRRCGDLACQAEGFA